VTAAEEIAAAAVFGGALLVTWAVSARDLGRRWRRERRARRRSRAVELLSMEAALEDDAFDPDRVREAVRSLLALPTTRRREDEPGHDWAATDRRLIKRWRAQHRIGAAAGLVGDPRIDLLQIVNRAGEAEDRVVVRLRAQFRDPARHRPGSVGRLVDDRWTLAKADGDWHLMELDNSPLADALLASPVVATDWADDDRLREQSLTELADQDPAIDEDLITDGDGARRQLLDLAVVDAHFTPELLQVALEQLIEAWEQATNGIEDPLSLRASALACEQLLHVRSGGEPLDIVLRDARLDHWRPMRVAATAVEVQVSVGCVRYVIDAATRRHRYGSRDQRHDIVLEWTLGRTPSGTLPWQLTHSTDPARTIAGIDTASSSSVDGGPQTEPALPVGLRLWGWITARTPHL
jgi:hypothetical protein